MRLKGKRTIVTGGGQGIGEGVARAFDKEGARVAILDINPDAARAVSRDFENALVIQCDIADKDSVEAAFQQVAAAFGGLDVLAHVAAIKPVRQIDRLNEIGPRQHAELAAGGEVTTFLDSIFDMSDEDWDRQIKINLYGTFYCTRAALRIMVPQRSGSIINTASNTAITGMAGVANYAASKTGVLGFSRSLAQEVIRQGVRINIVAPGGTDTPMPSEGVRQMKISRSRAQPIGRLGTLEELGAAYVFLASDESSFVVGETLNVNGGLHTL